MKKRKRGPKQEMIRFVDRIAKEYYDVKKPYSFSGRTSWLRRRAKNKEQRKALSSWFEKQRPYTLHRDVRHKFPRQKTLAHGIDHIWQMDLIDVQRYKTYNDDCKYLLAVICVFSRQAQAVPLWSKKPADVVEAFKKVVEDKKSIFYGRHPYQLSTDSGGEFKGAFSKFLQERGIRHFFATNPDTKASIVERWIRTLMTTLSRFFTHTNSHRFLDDIDDIVASYNRRIHRSIGRAPIDVTLSNQEDVRRRLYFSHTGTQSAAPEFEVGDVVRISQTKNPFSKGYHQSWTEELFRVTDKSTAPRFVWISGRRYSRKSSSNQSTLVPDRDDEAVTYSLTDLEGEKIGSRFYGYEMVKTQIPETYLIEKILQRRRLKGGGEEMLVKWQGFPAKFNSWVRASDVQSLNTASTRKDV